MSQAADLVLCLFPFEPALYGDLPITARYTGHPLADAIPLEANQDEARRRLGLDPEAPCLALLPGSRRSEIEQLTPPLLEAASKLVERYPRLRCVAALADAEGAGRFKAELTRYPALTCQVFEGHATQVMTAADVVVCASGTASLECLLVNRPMVVVYRFSAASYRLARGLRLVKSPHIALPNILAGEKLVPELLQEQANGATIATAVGEWLNDPQGVAALRQRFDAMHRELRQDAAASAASAVAELLDRAR
jgi:lipid-A-disaccharide synthase